VTDASKPSTRSERASEAPRTPKSVAESPQSPPYLSTPPQAPVRAVIAKLFGSWYVRVNGQLALGPLDKSRAQDHADRMNKVAP
jgi:hypothetical protein